MNVHNSTNRSASRGGFALVATLSLMILLVVIAVGMLTLSSLSLRSTSQADLLGQAKSNARLALMIAIGEVQKGLGPDRSAAGPASMVLANPSEPHVPGVWESWTWNPTTDSPPNYQTEKSTRFRGWLMSDSEEPGRRLNLEFPSTSPENAVRLVGAGSATNSTGVDPPNVSAGVVSVRSGKSRGQGYSWVALQEDTKAHVQPGAGALPATDEGLLAAMFAPDESGLKSLQDIGSLAENRTTRQRALSTSTLSLAADDAEVAPRSFHHLSPYPMGVLADSAFGGLRRDLTTEFEEFDNSDLKDERLYDAGTGAEPWWNALASYYHLANRVKGEADGGKDPLNIDADLTQFAELSGSNTAPKRAVLTPVVAKVDILFSLVTHDLRDDGNYKRDYKLWDKSYTGSQHYSPYLVFEPIITLWNPYNVPIEFTELKLTFDKIPVGFRFQKKQAADRSFVDVRIDPTEYWWPLSKFVWAGDKVDAISEFYVRLQGGDSNSGPGGEVELAPGETRVFTAWVDENSQWKDIESQFNIKTATDAERIVQSGDGVVFTGGLNRTGGFRFDHLARYRTSRNQASLYDFERANASTFQNDWHFVVLRESDRIKVRARLLDNDNPDETKTSDLSGLSDRSFRMNISLISKGAGNYNDVSASTTVQEMDVAVEDFFNLYQVGEDRIIEHDVSAIEVYQSPTTRGPGPKSTFAVLSLNAKPTRNLLHDTKGWLFGNPVTASTIIDENQAPFSLQSHEMSFRQIFGSNGFPMADVDQTTGTRGFFGPGLTGEYGLTAATMFTLPSEPLTSIGQFHSANVLASGAQPHFNYPVGNSHAHPLLAASQVKQGSFLDHSFALNWRLWDSYYFSSLSENARVKPAEFANGETPLNSRLEYYQGNTSTTGEAINEMTTGDLSTRSRQVAAHQLLRGPFNVNSTSVDAWTAILGGLRDRSVVNRDGSRRDSDEKIPFARFISSETSNDEALAVGAGFGTGGREVELASRWVGIHLLEDEQIVALATNIVEQIKARGREDNAPILTLGEFVNRRPGNGIHSLRGILQTAIEETNRNSALFSLEDGDPIAINTTRGIANTEALEGNTAEGSPADLLQGDILQAIGSFLTTHTDTLRIRAYGKAGEGANVREAWCEAIIQRVPQYVDATLSAAAIPEVDSVNDRFGRRYQIVSFRWLSRAEI